MPCDVTSWRTAGVQRIFDRDDVFVANMLIGMGVKLFFAGTLSLESVVMQSASELKLDERRRQFLRYVFHEIRVPLNTITMGITVLKEEARYSKSLSVQYTIVQCSAVQCSAVQSSAHVLINKDGIPS